MFANLSPQVIRLEIYFSLYYSFYYFYCAIAILSLFLVVVALDLPSCACHCILRPAQSGALNCRKSIVIAGIVSFGVIRLNQTASVIFFLLSSLACYNNPEFSALEKINDERKVWSGKQVLHVRLIKTRRSNGKCRVPLRRILHCVAQ